MSARTRSIGSIRGSAHHPMRFVVCIVLVVTCSVHLLRAQSSCWMPVGAAGHIRGPNAAYAGLQAEAGDARVMVWDESRNPNDNPALMFGRVSTALSAGARDLDLTGYYALALAAHSDRALIVAWSWWDWTARAVVVDLDGNRIADVALDEAVAAAAMWDGGSFVVALLNNDGVTLARVGPDGEMVSAPRSLIANTRGFGGFDGNSQDRIRLVPFGDASLLVWQEGDAQHSCYITCSIPPPTGIIRTVLLRDDAIVGGSLHGYSSTNPLTVSSNALFSPVVAVGDSVAMAWLEQHGRDSDEVSLHVHILDSELTTTRKLVIDDPTAFHPSLLWRGDRLLVVWGDWNPSPGHREVKLAEVGPSGPPIVSTLPASSVEWPGPSIAPSDEGGFLLLFNEGENIVLQRYDCLTIERRRGVRP